VAVMYDFNNVVTLYFMVNPSWKMKALDYLICAKLKIPGGILEFSNSKGDDLYKMRTFDDNGIKRPANLEKVMNAFLKNSKKTYNKRVEAVDDDVVPQVPLPFQQLINQIDLQIVSIKAKMAMDENIIKEVLENLEDNKLKELKEVFELRDGKTTGDKLASVADILWKEVGIINGNPHLKNNRIAMVELLLEVFGRNYHKFKSGNLTYSLEGFIKEIDAIENLRKGQGTAFERQNAAENQEVVAPRSCPLM
ncbi:unnamed protein product, partial [Cladocopium goreaui]